jgi:hypothetical protein
MCVSDFQTFRDLLLHCLKCQDKGDSQQALELIDSCLDDARPERPYESFWSTHNIQQALGFRIAFIEKVSKAPARAAEERHLMFCREHLDYWLSAAADASASLALLELKGDNPARGKSLAAEAVRLAGALGQISVTVAEAAEEARKSNV